MCEIYGFMNTEISSIILLLFIGSTLVVELEKNQRPPCDISKQVHTGSLKCKLILVVKIWINCNQLDKKMVMLLFRSR